MRFTAEISCFESTFDTDTIEELDEDGDVGDLQVKRRILEREKIALVPKNITMPLLSTSLSPQEVS